MRTTWSMRWAIIWALLRGHVTSVAWDSRGGRMTVEVVPTAEVRRRFLA